MGTSVGNTKYYYQELDGLDLWGGDEGAAEVKGAELPSYFSLEKRAKALLICLTNMSELKLYQ